MERQSSTRDRILEAARRHFNEHGYAATTLTGVASSVGISQGNLTYHFPTKRDLAVRLRELVRARLQERRATRRRGAIVDDYVEHLLFAMELTWSYRFLLRDRAQFADEREATQPPAELVADFDELRGLIDRLADAGMFRRSITVDLDALTRALWIVSRYWMDHLSEMERRDEITWDDQERGIDHHFTVLVPYLTTSARRRLEAALQRASRVHAAGGAPATAASSATASRDHRRRAR